jgi:hypothetical protein
MKTTNKTLSIALFLCFTGCDDVAPQAADVHARDAATDPCERLTLAGLDAIIDELDDAVALAEANAEAIVTDAYPAATQLAIDYLGDARDQLVSHRAWLTTSNIGITSTIGAYNTHAVAREAGYQASHGHYWAAISAIYNGKAEGELAAERGITAQLALAPLGADGLRCYMQAYLGD